MDGRNLCAWDKFAFICCSKFERLILYGIKYTRLLSRVASVRACEREFKKEKAEVIMTVDLGKFFFDNVKII